MRRLGAGNVADTEELEEKASDMREGSKAFNAEAHRVKCEMLKKDWKLTAMLVAAAVLAIVLLFGNIFAGDDEDGGDEGR